MRSIGKYIVTNFSCMYIQPMIVLYCIVLYLYIYIALLAVHTNQKRFQCERPREKRAVLRVRKEALGSPVNKVDREERRSWFQSEGRRANDCKGSCLSHRSPRPRDKEIMTVK